MWCEVYKEGELVYGSLDYVLLKASELAKAAVPTGVPYLVIVEAKRGINEIEHMFQLVSQMSACAEDPNGEKNAVSGFCWSVRAIFLIKLL